MTKHPRSMLDIEIRIQYLEDKLEDLRSRESTLMTNIELLKYRMNELESSLDGPESVKPDIGSYGGTK